MMKLVNKKTESSEMTKAWYQAALGTTIVSGVISLIIYVLLLSNYIQGKAADPLDSKELVDLKARLLRQPEDDAIKGQIRTLDLQLRKQYFQRREFSRTGAYMLLCSVSVFFIGARFAADFRRQLPMPQAISTGQNEEQRVFKLARWSVAVFGFIAGSGALFLVILNTRYSTLDTGYSMDAGLETRDLRLETQGTELKAQVVGQELQDAGSKTKNLQDSLESGSPMSEPPVSGLRSQVSSLSWPRFRGPGGLGTSAYTNIPYSWDGKTGSGIVWKTPISLPGNNSPIVWGEFIFLTGANEAKREVYCFDAQTGNILWQKAVENVPFSNTEPPKVSEDAGFAASTAATDGQRVFAIFANGDFVCFDFNGNQIWARNMGPFDNVYGYASSLTVYQNLLLVLLDQGGADDGISELIAVEVTSGRTVWQTSRPVPNSWATPIIINTGKREEIVTCANPYVIAYEPTTGKEFWRAKCLSGDVAPSPVYANGLVFAVNAYAVLAAIRPGGEGDVTATNIVWTARDGLPDICSPLSNGDLVFLLETYGNMTCYDAKNGSKVWEQDLAETFKASPSLVGDNIYLVTEEGVTITVKAGREFKELERSELGEKVKATPAFMDGRIYIRGVESLYCIANAQR